MKNKILLFLLLTVSSYSAAQNKVKHVNNLSKISTNDATNNLQTRSVQYWISNNGSGATDPNNQNAQGFYFPSNSKKSLIYQDGFLWSGSHNGELKSGGGNYVGGLQAGTILSNGFDASGVYTPAVADDPAKPEYKIYRIYKNWQNLSENDPEKAEYQIDYINWPISQGAPVDEFNNPKFLGDYVLFYVSNDLDASRSVRLHGSKSIGIEIQTTVWGFDRQFDSDKIVFIKKKLINKSGLPVSDFYMSIWCDPDLGNAADDLVGIDTILKLSYAYNGSNTDQIYTIPPAVGYTILSDDKQSSFVYFLGGGPIEMNDPGLGTYNGTIALNNYQRGLSYLGTSILDNGNKPTKFMNSGDPVGKTGDVDGIKFRPSDRRMLHSFGPYNFQSEQSIEITYAIIASQGTSNLESVSKLKALAKNARKIFTGQLKPELFPVMPQKSEIIPELSDRSVKLNWKLNSKAIKDYRSNGFMFEGFKVYQYKSPSEYESKYQLAYFDSLNSITTVYDSISVGNSFVIYPVALGTNTGLKHNLTTNYDYFTQSSLINGFSYHYGVSAVFVRPDTVNGIEVLKDPNLFKVKFPVSFEIPVTPIITVKPEHHYELGANYWYSGDTISVTRVGSYGGKITALIAQPEKLKGNQFKIEFKRDLFKGDSTMTWILKESIKDSILIQSKLDTTLITNGLWISIENSKSGFADFIVVSNAAGSIIPPEYGAADPTSQGFPRNSSNSINQDITRQQVATGAGSGWGIHTNPTGTSPINVNYDYFISRVTRSGDNWSHIIPYDFELRFTGAGGKAVNFYSNKKVIDVPFEIWNIGKNTPNDPSDDYRMIPWLNNSVGDPDVFDIGSDHVYSGGLNDPYSDLIYWRAPIDKTPGQFGYNSDIADAMADPVNYTGEKTDYEVLARIVVSSWNGGIAAPYARPLPEAGTTFRILTNKPATEDSYLTFSFDAKRKVSVNNTEKHYQFSLSQNYPNPFNPETKIQFELAKESFVNLTVYDILGREVTVLSNGLYEAGVFSNTWNGRSNSGSLVSSGVYFYKLNVKSTNGIELFNKTNKMILLK